MGQSRNEDGFSESSTASSASVSSSGGSSSASSGSSNSSSSSRSRSNSNSSESTLSMKADNDSDSSADCNNTMVSGDSTLPGTADVSSASDGDKEESSDGNESESDDAASISSSTENSSYSSKVSLNSKDQPKPTAKQSEANPLLLQTTPQTASNPVASKSKKSPMNEKDDSVSSATSASDTVITEMAQEKKSARTTAQGDDDDSSNSATSASDTVITEVTSLKSAAAKTATAVNPAPNKKMKAQDIIQKKTQRGDDSSRSSTSASDTVITEISLQKKASVAETVLHSESSSGEEPSVSSAANEESSVASDESATVATYPTSKVDESHSESATESSAADENPSEASEALATVATNPNAGQDEHLEESSQSEETAITSFSNIDDASSESDTVVTETTGAKQGRDKNGVETSKRIVKKELVKNATVNHASSNVEAITADRGPKLHEANATTDKPLVSEITAVLDDVAVEPTGRSEELLATANTQTMSLTDKSEKIVTCKKSKKSDEQSVLFMESQPSSPPQKDQSNFDSPPTSQKNALEDMFALSSLELSPRHSRVLLEEQFVVSPSKSLKEKSVLSPDGEPKNVSLSSPAKSKHVHTSTTKQGVKPNSLASFGEHFSSTSKNDSNLAGMLELQGKTQMLEGIDVRSLGEISEMTEDTTLKRLAEMDIGGKVSDNISNLACIEEDLASESSIKDICSEVKEFDFPPQRGPHLEFGHHSLQSSCTSFCDNDDVNILNLNFDQDKALVFDLEITAAKKTVDEVPLTSTSLEKRDNSENWIDDRRKNQLRKKSFFGKLKRGLSSAVKPSFRKNYNDLARKKLADDEDDSSSPNFGTPLISNHEGLTETIVKDEEWKEDRVFSFNSQGLDDDHSVESQMTNVEKIPIGLEERSLFDEGPAVPPPQTVPKSDDASHRNEEANIPLDSSANDVSKNKKKLFGLFKRPKLKNRALSFSQDHAHLAPTIDRDELLKQPKEPKTGFELVHGDVFSPMYEDDDQLHPIEESANCKSTDGPNSLGRGSGPFDKHRNSEEFDRGFVSEGGAPKIYQQDEPAFLFELSTCTTEFETDDAIFTRSAGDAKGNVDEQENSDFNFQASDFIFDISNASEGVGASKVVHESEHESSFYDDLATKSNNVGEREVAEVVSASKEGKHLESAGAPEEANTADAANTFNEIFESKPVKKANIDDEESTEAGPASAAKKEGRPAKAAGVAAWTSEEEVTSTLNKARAAEDETGDEKGSGGSVSEEGNCTADESASDVGSDDNYDDDDASTSEEGSEGEDAGTSEEGSMGDSLSTMEEKEAQAALVSGEGSEAEDSSASDEGSEAKAAIASGEGSEAEDSSASDEGSEAEDANASGEGSEAEDSSASDEGSEADAASASGEGSEGEDSSACDEGSEAEAASASEEGSEADDSCAYVEGSEAKAEASSADEGSEAEAASASEECSEAEYASSSDEGSDAEAASASDEGSETEAASASGDVSEHEGASASIEADDEEAARTSDEASEADDAGKSEEGSKAEDGSASEECSEAVGTIASDEGREAETASAHKDGREAEAVSASARSREAKGASVSDTGCEAEAARVSEGGIAEAADVSVEDSTVKVGQVAFVDFLEFSGTLSESESHARPQHGALDDFESDEETIKEISAIDVFTNQTFTIDRGEVVLLNGSCISDPKDNVLVYDDNSNGGDKDSVIKDSENAEASQKTTVFVREPEKDAPRITALPRTNEGASREGTSVESAGVFEGNASRKLDSYGSGDAVSFNACAVAHESPESSPKRKGGLAMFGFALKNKSDSPNPKTAASEIPSRLKVATVQGTELESGVQEQRTDENDFEEDIAYDVEELLVTNNIMRNKGEDPNASIRLNESGDCGVFDVNEEVGDDYNYSKEIMFTEADDLDNDENDHGGDDIGETNDDLYCEKLEHRLSDDEVMASGEKKAIKWPFWSKGRKRAERHEQAKSTKRSEPCALAQTHNPEDNIELPLGDSCLEPSEPRALANDDIRSVDEESAYKIESKEFKSNAVRRDNPFKTDKEKIPSRWRSNEPKLPMFASHEDDKYNAKSVLISQTLTGNNRDVPYGNDIVAVYDDRLKSIDDVESAAYGSAPETYNHKWTTEAKPSFCCRHWRGLALVALAIIGLVIGSAIGAALSRRNNAGGNKGASPVPVPPVSAPPVAAPVVAPSPPTTGGTSPIQDDKTYKLLCSVLVDCSPLLNKNTPQGMAFEWLVDPSTNPNLPDYSADKTLTRYALATFFHSTQGGSWVDKTDWLSQIDECDWFTTAVPPICNSVGNLVTLQLDNNNLQGGLPFELSLLTSLTSLSLRNPEGTAPDIRGNLQEFVGVLTGLTSLIIAGNQLTGGIPPEIGQLTQLQIMDLSSNDLTGGMPFSFEALSSLRSLKLHQNKLTGGIPSQFLQGASGLEEIDLEGNSFTSVPETIGSLTSLLSLKLGSNRLITFSVDLTGLTSLQLLDISGNGFGGQIPSQLGGLTTLNELHLSGNDFTGSIPISLANLLNLSKNLDLSGNHLSGSIPFQLGQLVQLQKLYLNSNKLSGSIPPELVRLSKITAIRFDSNNLTGTVPPLVCSLYDVTKAVSYADCNELQGSSGCFSYCCTDGQGCVCQFQNTDFQRCLQ